MDIEKNIEETLNEEASSTSQLEAQEATVQGEETPTGEVSKPETVKIGDQEYTIDQVQEAIQRANDYKYLLPEYTRATQRLAEYEKQKSLIQQQAAQSNVPEDQLQEAVNLYFLNYFLFFSNKFVSVPQLQQIEEDKKLEETLSSLEEEYDGTDGRPKFDRRAVLEYCVVNGIPDPEKGYLLMNQDKLTEWKLRQAKTAPVAPPSSSGEGVTTQPQPKRRVFGGPESDNEVNIREAIEQSLGGNE